MNLPANSQTPGRRKLLLPGCGQTRTAGVCPRDCFRWWPHTFSVTQSYSESAFGKAGIASLVGTGAQETAGGVDAAPRPAASLPGAHLPRRPPATPGKRSPTSHLFGRKRLERPRSWASGGRRDGARPGVRGAVFPPPAAARRASYQQIARLRPATRRRRGCARGEGVGAEAQTFKASLRGRLPRTPREEGPRPRRLLPRRRRRAGDRRQPGPRDGRSVGSRRRNHGDGGGADGGGAVARLPAAGGAGGVLPGRPAARPPVTLRS